MNEKRVQDEKQKREENKPFGNATVINVISGKGGTGKTCFANVLANEIAKNHDHKVLVIDLDLPVRGTTNLLATTNNGKLKLAEGKSVSSFFQEYHKMVFKPIADMQLTVDRIEAQRKKFRDNFESAAPAISKFDSFYVIPATDWIEGDYIDFDSIFQLTNEDINCALTTLIKSAQDSCKREPLHLDRQFDYIFLDNRAGYDRFVAEAHRISKFSILVEEDDNVSSTTADNLNEQLRSLQIKEGKITTPILRVRNKVLQENLSKNPRNQLYVSDIPFDMDVMRFFGERRFWGNIRGTLYHRAVIKAWNDIEAKMGLSAHLQDIGSLGVAFKIVSKLSILPALGRLLFLYGLLSTFSAFILLFTLVYGKITPQMMEEALNFPVITVLLFLAVTGMLLTIISVFFIGAKRERPKVDLTRDYQDDA